MGDELPLDSCRDFARRLIENGQSLVAGQVGKFVSFLAMGRQ
jgi:hypothetical protein